MNIIKNLFSKKYRSRAISYVMVTVAYVVMQLLINGNKISFLMKGLMVPLCCYIIASLALNLVVGVLGDLSLGQAGFMSVGCYTGVVAANIMAYNGASSAVCMIAALVVGTVCALLVGVLVSIPVLKLEGDYLAIVTLAFGQIIKTLLSNLYLGIDETGLHFAYVTNNMELSSNGKLIVNGPVGFTGNKTLSTFFIGFVLVLITLIIIYNLMYSKQGRAIMACRDNKIAATSVGVSTVKFKLMAFVISAALAGLAGALYGMNYASIGPTKFDFNLSILMLVYVVLGGLGNMNGTIIATTILLILPEKLRFLNDYRMVIYAVVLIVMMIAKNNPTMKQLTEKLTSKFRKNKKEVADNE